jgi:hypothetical protein
MSCTTTKAFFDASGPAFSGFAPTTQSASRSFRGEHLATVSRGAGSLIARQQFGHRPISMAPREFE